MRQKIDVRAGDKYTRWRVVSGPYGASSLWEVVCDCGAVGMVGSWKLFNGHSKSCGCLKRETSTARATVHGQRGKPEYLVWSAMRDRCNNPANRSYRSYGGRGVFVDPSWNCFKTFIDDMGPRPPGHSLERRDNNGPYAKWNCVWADRVAQANNTRRNVWVEFGGQRLTAAQWAKVLLVPYREVLKLAGPDRV